MKHADLSARLGDGLVPCCDLLAKTLSEAGDLIYYNPAMDKKIDSAISEYENLHIYSHNKEDEMTIIVKLNEGLEQIIGNASSKQLLVQVRNMSPGDKMEYKNYKSGIGEVYEFNSYQS